MGLNVKGRLLTVRTMLGIVRTMLGNPVVAHGAKVVSVSVTFGADDHQQRRNPSDHGQRPQHVAL